MRRVLSTDPSSGFFMGPGLSEHLSPKVDLTVTDTRRNNSGGGDLSVINSSRPNRRHLQKCFELIV